MCYTTISLAFPQLFFSFLLLILMNWSSSYLIASQKPQLVSIAPVFNQTLTLPTPNDSAGLLYGWKQSSSKCLPYKLEWSVGSHLSHVGFTWSTHFILSSGSLEKPYKCSRSLQVEVQPVEVQPIELSSCLDNRKTTHSSITLHMLYYANALSTCVAVPPPMYVTRKAPPMQEAFKNMLLKQLISHGKKVLEGNF